MNQQETLLRDNKSQSRVKIPDTSHGFFNSTTIALPAGDIFAFCQNEENLKKVLADLPSGMVNFFDLELSRSEQKTSENFELEWVNRPNSITAGTLTFILQKAPANRGTILSAIAEFEKFHSNNEEASDLVNIFLKRMKALCETGEIATTKGQPSGREELKIH